MADSGGGGGGAKQQGKKRARTDEAGGNKAAAAGGKPTKKPRKPRARKTKPKEDEDPKKVALTGAALVAYRHQRHATCMSKKRPRKAHTTTAPELHGCPASHLQALCDVILEHVNLRPAYTQPVNSFRIDWRLVSAEVRRRGGVEWDGPACQRVWKYLAYGRCAMPALAPNAAPWDGGDEYMSDSDEEAMATAPTDLAHGRSVRSHFVPSRGARKSASSPTRFPPPAPASAPVAAQATQRTGN
jgi:hypothetical protein